MTAKSVEGATKQATDVVLNPKATKEQKVEAVSRVVEATAVEVGKSTVRRVATPARIARAKAAVKRAGPAILAAAKGYGAPITAAVAGGAAVSRLQKSRVTKQARAMLADAIRRTPAGQRAQFTPSVRAQLLRQYEAHIRRQNEILFTK